jgi:manganese/zinc/iron transport system permease protein
MVGVVMVAALTIIPPVTARLWVSSLGAMLVLAAGVGVVSAVVGVLISASAEGLPSGPLIVLSAAAIFTLSALFAPGRGLVAVASRLRRQRLRYGAETLVRLAPLRESDTASKLKEQGVRSPRAVVRFALSENVIRLRDGILEAA